MRPDELPLTVCAYVRPTQFLPEVDRYLSTLRQLERQGVIDSLLTEEWPSETVLSDRSPFSPAVAHFTRFQRWAESAGVSIQPPFSVHERRSAFVDDTRQILVTPVICLAMFEGDRLVSVFPHADDERYYTVADAVDALVAGDAAHLSLQRVGPTPVEHSRLCDHCGGQLVNVQGITVCSDCRSSDDEPGRRLVVRSA